MQESPQAGPSNAAGHPEQAALALFARGVLSMLTVWPALRIVMSHGWSKSASSAAATSDFPPESPQEKRIRLAEELVDAYYTTYVEKNKTLPEPTDIEDFLLEYIEVEYGITLDDGSEMNLAKDLQKMWLECVQRAAGQVNTDNGMVERFEQMADKAREQDSDPTRAMRGTRGRQEGDEEDPESSDEESGDESMDVEMQDNEEPPQLINMRQK